mmetsp:Transcript_26590/g.67599  ORF Transcript_26590/g.67599 Transcript_26590/m.67599 type:complete len:88 (+) Transcript_26590:305-568(+)
MEPHIRRSSTPGSTSNVRTVAATAAALLLLLPLLLLPLLVLLPLVPPLRMLLSLVLLLLGTLDVHYNPHSESRSSILRTLGELFGAQ